MTHLTFPNESAEYRKARNKLLAEEMALRSQIEAVAAQHRSAAGHPGQPRDSASGPGSSISALEDR